MCRKKKKTVPQNTEPTPEQLLDSFELKKTEPVVDANGKRDYFTEYYNAYKNNYIDQYLNAYKKFKEDGILPDYSPYEEVKTLSDLEVKGEETVVPEEKVNE